MGIPVNRKRFFIKKLKEKNNVLSSLSSWNGLVLAVSTAIAYGIIYCYYFGIFYYFGINASFIHITLGDNVIGIILIGLAFSFILLYGSMVYDFFITTESRRIMILPYIGIIFINFLAVILWFISSKTYFLIVFGIIDIFFIFLFAFLLLLSKFEKVLFVNKILQKFIKFNSELSKKEKVIDKYNKLTALLLLASLLFGITISFGRFAASTNNIFEKSNYQPDCSIIYTDSEKFICVPYDKNSNTFSSYRVIYFKDSPILEFEKENIGPLHPKPTPTPTPLPTNTPTITPTETTIPTLTSKP